MMKSLALFVAAKKLSAYTTLGTATKTADVSSAIRLSANASRVTSATGDSVDYTNPKAIRVEGDLTMHGGRLRVCSTCDGGEGRESKSNLTIYGGVVMSFGSATEMAYGSSGTQKSYRNTSASASTYAGKYVTIAGSTATDKVPAMSSSSGSVSIMCSAPNGTASAPSVSTSAPTSGAIGFHGVYIQ